MMGVPMFSRNSRKVFLVVAGGNPAAERHFVDTIQRKRKLDEVRKFLQALVKAEFLCGRRSVIRRKSETWNFQLARSRLLESQRDFTCPVSTVIRHVLHVVCENTVRSDRNYWFRRGKVFDDGGVGTDCKNE